MVTNVSSEEDEDQINDSNPTAQERRLGLDINIRETGELNLGTRRSQTQD